MTEQFATHNLSFGEKDLVTEDTRLSPLNQWEWSNANISGTPQNQHSQYPLESHSQSPQAATNNIQTDSTPQAVFAADASLHFASNPDAAQSGNHTKKLPEEAKEWVDRSQNQEVSEILEEDASQAKRARIESPSQQVVQTTAGSSQVSMNAPLCQVDGCRADLSGAKDYHRRHKVCEMHSKAATVMLADISQRFCQQCSRFHQLTEFDEGKRSCRRRLLGHNQRRRKVQSSGDSQAVGNVRSLSASSKALENVREVSNGDRLGVSGSSPSNFNSALLRAQTNGMSDPLHLSSSDRQQGGSHLSILQQLAMANQQSGQDSRDSQILAIQRLLQEGNMSSQSDSGFGDFHKPQGDTTAQSAISQLLMKNPPQLDMLQRLQLLLQQQQRQQLLDWSNRAQMSLHTLLSEELNGGGHVGGSGLSAIEAALGASSGLDSSSILPLLGASRLQDEKLESRIQAGSTEPSTSPFTTEQVAALMSGSLGSNSGLDTRSLLSLIQNRQQQVAENEQNVSDATRDSRTASLLEMLSQHHVHASEEAGPGSLSAQ